MTVTENKARYIALSNNTSVFEYPVDEFEEDFIFLPSVLKTTPKTVAKNSVRTEA